MTELDKIALEVATEIAEESGVFAQLTYVKDFARRHQRAEGVRTMKITATQPPRP